MNKREKITNTMQKVAVDILEDIEFLLMTRDKTVEIEKIAEIFFKYKEKYELCEDPFAKTVCTSYEHYKSNIEYQRQVMEEKYGHHDGLE